jgi:hypothetical protein
VTPPTDASVDGYSGKTFQRTAPVAFTGCDLFRGWDTGSSTDPDTNPEIYYDPGEVETVRILGLNGTIIVVSARLKRYHQDSAAASLTAVLDSIRIDPAPAPDTAARPASTQPVTT